MQPLRSTMQLRNKFGATILLLLALSVHHTAPASERFLQMRQKRQASPPNSCPDPGTPRHSLRQPQELRPSFSEGAVVSYGCISGYRLQGSPQLTCRYNKARASWSAPVPQCIGEEVKKDAIGQNLPCMHIEEPTCKLCPLW